MRHSIDFETPVSDWCVCVDLLPPRILNAAFFLQFVPTFLLALGTFFLSPLTHYTTMSTSPKAENKTVEKQELKEEKVSHWGV